jgi:signal peptidase I
MASTAITVLVVLSVFLLLLFLWVVLLKLGLRWIKAKNVRKRRLCAAAAISHGSRLIAAFFLYGTASDYASSEIKMALLEVAVNVLIGCLTITVVFRTPLTLAFKAWLPTLIQIPAIIALHFLVVQPYLFETFVTPTNSMAPTIVGDHWLAVCPECGQPGYLTIPYNEKPDPDRPDDMICEAFHMSQIVMTKQPTVRGDHFLMSKFIKPERWDIVGFRYPKDPSVEYVKRLIGLPGELIHIDAGAVWVNGEKLTPPASLQGIKYLADEEWEPWDGMSGTVKNPAQLGEGEYFVLGDFTRRSMDSRYWTPRDDGHPPYAVPESHILGVVTHIYWPPARCRILR